MNTLRSQFHNHLAQTSDMPMELEIVSADGNYQYDSKGNVIEENNSNNSQNKCGGIVLEDSYSYKSELDDKSNWIKQTRYNEDGFADLITEKKIVYYGDKDENEYSSWESIDYQGIEIE